jgi:hypothetical protein
VGDPFARSEDLPTPLILHPLFFVYALTCRLER